MANEKLDAIEAQIEDEIDHPPKKGLINEEKAKHQENQPDGFSVRFQLIATAVIIISAIAGGGLGILLSDKEADEDLISWLALPGDLFIRALKCVVLPLIFVNVIIAVIQMIEAGKAGAVGKYTIGVYLLTTFIASIEGLLAVLIFQDRFKADEIEEDPITIRLLCPDTSRVVVENEQGQLECVFENEAVNDNFTIDNVNDFFQTSQSSFESVSFSQTLQDGIFRKLIPDNIVNEFASGGFLGVVMFGIIFGAAAAALKRKPVLLLQFLEDINDIFITVVTWIIYVTPIAVFSLIVGALASQENLAETFENIGVLVLASICAILIHLFVVYPLIFFFFTRDNPYSYMRYIIPAQIFAFSCASSAATLPVTMRCVTQTGKVPDSIRDFVLPIGATVNMDGTALYFPIALVFLANTAGIESGVSEFFLLVLVSTIGSAGAAPVPNAGLVLIITGFNTVYGGGGIPDNFAILVGIDWLMDRFQTALNITGDSMVSRIVTRLAGADVVDGVVSQLPVSQLADE